MSDTSDSSGGWIGRLVLPGGRTATLGGDGLWRSADGDLALHLNARYPASGPPADSGLAAVLPEGRLAVAVAACELEGRAEYREALAPIPPGAVS